MVVGGIVGGMGLEANRGVGNVASRQKYRRSKHTEQSYGNAR